MGGLTNDPVPPELPANYGADDPWGPRGEHAPNSPFPDGMTLADAYEMTHGEPMGTYVKPETDEAAPRIDVEIPMPEAPDDNDGADTDPARAELLARLAAIAIPERFWDLSHLAPVAQAADAQGVKREGFLALVMNRAALLAGPNILGSFANREPFTLTSYNALTGLSGSGSNLTRRAVEAYLPTPEKLTQKNLRGEFDSSIEAEAYDHGYTRVSPPTGSTLVSHMQRTVGVVVGEHPSKTNTDGSPVKVVETRSIPIPRVHATYAEGESLLGALNKSASASSQGAGLQPLLLDAFVGDELRADVADKNARPPVPAGSYALAVDAYFQMEILGLALERTTGLTQRFRYIPILMRKRPQWVLDTVYALATGREVGDEDKAKVAAYLRKHPMPLPPEPAHAVVTSVAGSADDAGSWHVQGPTRMTMCTRMESELDMVVAALSGGLSQDDPLVSHIALNLYRSAAQSALLRCSRVIEEADWELALALSAVGEEVKRVARDWGRWQEEQNQGEENAKAAGRAAATANAHAIASGHMAPLAKQVARRMRDKILRVGKPLGVKDLKNTINGAHDVDLWTKSGGPGGRNGLFEAALRYAAGNGLIAPALPGPRGGDRYELGRAPTE